MWGEDIGHNRREVAVSRTIQKLVHQREVVLDRLLQVRPVGGEARRGGVTHRQDLVELFAQVGLQDVSELEEILENHRCVDRLG